MDDACGRPLPRSLKVVCLAPALPFGCDSAEVLELERDPYSTATRPSAVRSPPAP